MAPTVEGVATFNTLATTLTRISLARPLLLFARGARIPCLAMTSETGRRQCTLAEHTRLQFAHGQRTEQTCNHSFTYNQYKQQQEKQHL